MALTLEQLNLKYGRPEDQTSGGTPMTPENIALEQARISNLRSEKPAPSEGRFAETMEDLKQTGSSIASRWTSGADKIAEINQARQEGQGLASTLFQKFTTGAGVAAGTFDDLFTGVVKGVLSSEQETAVKAKVEETAKKAIENPIVGEVASQWKRAYEESSPEMQRNMEGMFNIAMLGLEVYGSSLIRKGISKTKQVGSEVLEGVGKQVDQAPVSLPETTPPLISQKTPDVISGIKQQITELGERFPRAIEKGKTASQEATERASKIESSSPAVANAIKVKLDDRIITTVADADKVTLKAYKEMVDIAGSTSKKLSDKKRPEIVAGKAAENQFKIINDQRKVVGEQIGTLADELSKTTKIDMTESFNTLKGTLGKAGVVVKPKGGLTIEPLRYTPPQEKLIRDLYKLAKKGGDKLTPSQIHSADRLFSTLQREANVEQISNVILKTSEGDKNMFQVFRDVFSKELDNVSPEIKELNREYRSLKTMVDDVANSIVKGGKFETLKGVSNAEFAQTNLRRMLSDAQSATSYREIARQLDSMARTFGYKGAKPEDLITFATEMRKLYPDIIPVTSFTGGIRTGLRTGTTDIVEKVLRAGKPELIDQQKALQELLDELLQPAKKGSPVVGKTTELGKSSNILIQEVKKFKTSDDFLNSPNIEFHLSTSSNLKEGKTFAQLPKTDAFGTRGTSNLPLEAKEGIFTSKIPDQWLDQIRDELQTVPGLVDEFLPTNLYLVKIKNPTKTFSGLQENVSDLKDVTILKKLDIEDINIFESQVEDIFNSLKGVSK